MFPLAADLTIVQGYVALVQGMSSAVWKLVRGYWFVFLAYGLLAVATIWIMLTWSRYRDNLLHRLEKRPKVDVAIRIGSVSLIAMAIPSVAIPLGALLVVLVLSLPMATAKLYAEDQVERQVQAFRKGCVESAKNAGIKCVRISKEGVSIAQGYLIGSSETHLAIFEPVNRVVMLIERGGITLVGMPRVSVALPASPL